MKQLKVGVVGCGSMATRAHGPSYQKYAALHSDTRLVACCDLNEDRARAFQAQYGFERWYTDVDEMLDQEQPDAVCLVAPVHLTAELSIRILEKGCPLLMEKPPGQNLTELSQMIAAAERSGAAHQVAFNRRFIPLVQQLKEVIAERTNGSPDFIRYDFLRMDRRDPDFAATAIHGIDAARYIAGSPYQSVRFRYQEWGAGVANIYMDAVFESGLVAQLSFCPMAGVIIERAMVITNGHTFFVELPFFHAHYDAPGRLIHIENGAEAGVWVPADFGAESPFESNGFYMEVEAFLNHVRNGEWPIHDLRSAVQSVLIADCIRNRRSEYTFQS